MARASSTSSFLLLLAAVAVIASLSVTPVSAAKCHPDDKKALLAIKRFWNNPYSLASWVPTTGCCSWIGVECDYMTSRVTSLTISDDANITGTIPPAVGDLRQLRSLDIRRLPNLTGTVPLALTKLRKLSFLRLEQSGLTGPVPAFLAQLSDLWYLNLGSNRLTGSIPAALVGAKKLRLIALDHNRLTGPIPPEFGKLPIRAGLALSNNNLSGTLPPALGAVHFVSIDLSSNQLSGDATFLFGRSKAELISIDLSGNMFEFDLGRVEFPTVGDLRDMNLRHNRIYGRIPEEIANLTYLETLDLSNNQLCGKVPTGGYLGYFTAEAYAHNRCLCGTPLPPCK